MASNPVPSSGLRLTVNETPTDAVVQCSGRITSDSTESLKASEAAVLGRQIYRAGFVECKLSRQLRAGDDRRIVCLGEKSEKRVEDNAFERAPEGTHQSHKARGVFGRRARPERKTAALTCESLHDQQSAPAEPGQLLISRVIGQVPY